MPPMTETYFDRAVAENADNIRRAFEERTRITERYHRRIQQIDDQIDGFVHQQRMLESRRRFRCDCGADILGSSRAAHFRSRKHMSFFSNQGQNPINTDCSICLDPVNENSKTLVCNHQFCTGCIDKWLEKNRSCPTCRRVVR